MGMSIDEAMYLIEHHKPNDVNNAYELGEAFCVAIKTMSKYQKIEQILNKDFEEYHPLDRNLYRLSLIREVLKDGKIDRR